MKLEHRCALYADRNANELAIFVGELSDIHRYRFVSLNDAVNRVGSYSLIKTPLDIVPPRSTSLPSCFFPSSPPSCFKFMVSFCLTLRDHNRPLPISLHLNLIIFKKKKKEEEDSRNIFKKKKSSVFFNYT